jgi:hypothetical protein
LTHLTNIRTRNRGAHTDIARIAEGEVAIVLAIDLAIVLASDTVTPIPTPTPYRAVIVITMTTTEETFARRSRTNAVRDTFLYGSLNLM